MTEKIKKSKPRHIKFNIFPKMEYFDLIKGQELLIRLSDAQLEQMESLPRSKAQILLYTFLYQKHGSKYSPGYYNYQFKEPGGTKIELGKIRLIADESLNIKVDDMADKNFETELQAIKKQIAEIAKSGSGSVDIITNALKLGHEAQVTFLNMQISDKDKKIAELKEDIRDLEKQLDNAEKVLSETNTTGMMSKVLDGITGLMKTKPGPVETVSLKDSGDIPGELMNVINSVDWNQVTPEDVAHSVQAFNQFIAFKRFPKKTN